MHAVEVAALEAEKTLLVLDTVTGSDAVRLYKGLAGSALVRSLLMRCDLTASFAAVLSKAQ